MNCFQNSILKLNIQKKSLYKVLSILKLKFITQHTSTQIRDVFEIDFIVKFKSPGYQFS